MSFADSLHTTGVGTFVYAAPEQLNGCHYDSKVNTLQEKKSNNNEQSIILVVQSIFYYCII